MPHSQPDVLIKRVLGEAGQAVSFADMAVLGRNPARIIPAICRFTDSRHPRRTRSVDEPVWAGRYARRDHRSDPARGADQRGPGSRAHQRDVPL